MKRLMLILTCISLFAVVLYAISQVEDKREVSEEITLEQVQMYEIPDATADIEEVDKELLKEYRIIELESGETHVFNIYGAYLVNEIMYLRETKVFHDESEARMCGKFLYESIERPEILYEQSDGFLHYIKKIPMDINLNYGDMYHKIVFYDSSYRIPLV